MKEIQVFIVMGSDSDLSIMRGAAEILEQFEIGFDVRVLSAHRTPEEVISTVSKLREQHCKVIIAGAGGAAHLAGVVAAHTILPVIGVPISSSLMGFDSLLSTVQMPNGIPVATVGIDRSKNAGLLAVAIIALGDKKIQEKLEKYRKDMKAQVLKKDKEIETNGWKK